MTRLFYLLWHGCWHVWTPQSEGHWEGVTYTGPVVYCSCKKCGRWQSFWGVLK